MELVQSTQSLVHCLFPAMACEVDVASMRNLRQRSRMLPEDPRRGEEIAHTFAAIVRQWTTSSWSTMAEMLALPINSRPTERLTNKSAGVDKCATWQEVLRIRDVDGAKLSLVFDVTGAGEKPALGGRVH